MIKECLLEVEIIIHGRVLFLAIVSLHFVTDLVTKGLASASSDIMYSVFNGLMC